MLTEGVVTLARDKSRDPPARDLRRVGAHPDHWYPRGLVAGASPRQDARRPLRGPTDRSRTHADRGVIRA